MTIEQQKAADPSHSVWVSASAGSGKTKVLTDRVLRMLLDNVSPQRILCLTYTKAAAAEMSNRIQETLGEWAACSDQALVKALTGLVGNTPTEEQKRTARELLVKVLEAPEGMRMMTIHSLCQSILRRFSIEATVSPYFRVAEEYEAQQLLQQARERLLAAPNDAESVKVAEVVSQMASTMAESSFDALLEEIISHRGKLLHTLKGEDGAERLKQRLMELLGIEVSDSKEALQRRYFDYSDVEKGELRELIPYLEQGSDSTDKPIAQGIAQWLADVSTAPDAEAYCRHFLTKQCEPRKQILTKKVVKICPQAMEILEREQQRCIDYIQALFAQENYEAALQVVTLAEALLRHYQELKLRRGVLDFEDLIENTAQLLEKSGVAPWVLFKLDGGLDHLLVDEAQDTSPAQWRIIDSLASEFFTGQSASHRERSLFVVGDEKQSIYSFQGADPQAFADMKYYFSQKIGGAKKRFESVNLSLSFRSSKAVLQCVDAVFSLPSSADGLLFSEAEVKHEAFHKVPGIVELWPLAGAQEQPEREPWSIPDKKGQWMPPERMAAMQVADAVTRWLKEGRELAGLARPVRASDIMVLVRRRNRFVDFLTRELRQRGVPVAGADRLELSEHIAIQDMLALANFLLLPEDDLNLACLLKSPLIGLSEEQLFSLCYERRSTLWTSMQHSNDAEVVDAVTTLSALLNEVDYITPFALFAKILDALGGRQQFRARLGVEVDDPLNEFLSMALQFEAQQSKSLQSFVHWFGKTKTEIKRDMEQVADEVRILTVHGSKGLQAPIVFVPDTTALPTSKEQLLWSDEAFLWAHNASREAALVAQWKEIRKKRELQEYRRLLYVALTRAESELYITGWAGEKDISDDCWYKMVERAMKRIGHEFTVDGQDDQVGYRLTNDGEKKPVEENEAEIEKSYAEPPIWMNKEAPQEPSPPRPLSPSKPDDDTVVAPSFEKDQEAIDRGILTHRLLEILPDVEVSQRQAVAMEVAQRTQRQLSDEVRKAVIHEVMNILSDSRFAPVFSAGSMAEVPVTALVRDDGSLRPMSGRIDRLVVTAERVLIVDYKTNRFIPQSLAAVPASYQRQMEYYVQALRKLYPEKLVEGAVLWTSGPVLMPLLTVTAQAA